MPVVQSLMDNLVRQYGAAKGRSVYYAMEAEGSGPFAKGAKHHDLHQAFAERNKVPSIEDRGPAKTPKGRRPGTGRAGRGSSYKRVRSKRRAPGKR